MEQIIARVKRHHYFFLGLLLLAIGIQFRMVDRFVLTKETSRAIAERMNKSSPKTTTTLLGFLPGSTPIPDSQRSITLPRPVGWVLLSIGGVLVLHSLVLRGERRAED